MASRSLFSATLLLLAWTTTAAADPVTVIYQIEVTDRRSSETHGEWVPFQQEFTLLMTFDPALRAPLGTGFTYGPARFSAVPLAVFGPPAGTTLSSSGSTLHGQFEENDSFEPTDLWASAGQQEAAGGADWHYIRATNLTSQMVAPIPPPPYTGDTFPQHLVLNPFPFGYNAWFSGRHVGYRGAATLVQVIPPDPVPEPVTVALVGSGLVLMARTRRWTGRARRG